MTARDHIETARRQVEGAARRIETGKTRDARGVISGAIAELAKAQHELSWRDGYEAAQAEAKAQANLDRQVRIMRGRDAIARVLRTNEWSDAAALERANNIATGLSGAEPGDNVLGNVIDAIRIDAPDDATSALFLQVMTEIAAAWIGTERPPVDADAEGPCRAGDEERAPETSPPPAAA